MIIYENETKALSYTYKDENGDAVDIAAKSPYLYVYKDSNSTAVEAVSGTIGATTGEFSFSVAAASALSLLTVNRYYPYRVILKETNKLDIIVEEGILNYNKIQNNWEWNIDVRTGITLQELLNEANNYLRYTDWSDSKLTRFANSTLHDFSEKTFYVKGSVSITTKYATVSYIIPDEVLLLDSLYLDGELKVKNVDYYHTNKTITFVDNILDSASDGEVKGGQVIKLSVSKYAQKLIDLDDYIELPVSAADVITDGVILSAKLEDRAPQDEITTWWSKYKAGLDLFSERYLMDSLTTFTCSY